MTRSLDIEAARELRGLVAELRDTALSKVLAGQTIGGAEIAAMRRVLDILRNGDFSAQIEEVLSRYQAWAFEEGVAQIDGMAKGLKLDEVFRLPKAVFDAATNARPTKVVTIAQTLHDDLARTLRLGMAGIRTPEQVKRDIMQRFNVGASRAQTIATTEIKGTQNRAQEQRIQETFKAAGEKGVPMVKTWIHSSGQKVGFAPNAKRVGYIPRAHHKAMHGVTVKPNALFVLNAPGAVYTIDGPHDESLPASEVVNCHCGRGIEIDRETYKLRNKAATAAKP